MKEVPPMPSSTAPYTLRCKDLSISCSAVSGFFCKRQTLILIDFVQLRKEWSFSRNGTDKFYLSLLNLEDCRTLDFGKINQAKR